MGRKLYVATIAEQEWGQSDTFEWGGDGSVETVALSDHDGALNTQELTADSHGHPAAQQCADSTAHGLTDWYLPARLQIDTLYAAYNARDITSFDENLHWTSTTAVGNEDTHAEALNFYGGAHTVWNKSWPVLVRCVRSYTP